MLWGLLLGIAIGFVVSTISYTLQTKKRNNKNKASEKNETKEN